eukprot:CAMPEP_0118805794 /NCGR_PEP_ID=MMETSP1161-20130426/28851_1 /TAXON_ID=249345 /ORGANISM="Picochlorum oklahomensis, Strain CCMP2329" /LENGTH=56 /DNA_ID=CAMNT_0006734807 /DNA_START=36 /DNA_END=203 /DNA_ORIENTATION=+
MYPAWSHDVKDVLKHHKVDAKEGLEDVEAERRLEEFGPNELKKPEPTSLLAMVLEQ